MSRSKTMSVVARIGRYASVMALGLAASLSFAQSGAQDAPDEVVVTGRLPGPPLWRVSNGDHVLWIFAYTTPIPENMQWESDRAEGMINRSQEYLGMPDADLTVSPLVRFNPINIFRGMRLARRLSHNPDGQTLADVLPPDVYQRYAALKAKYFPRDTEVDELRPLLAGPAMARLVQREEGLGSAEGILKRIERLARRKDGLEMTDTEVKVRVDGGYRSLANRLEAMSESITMEQELACFEWHLARMETDLEAMKSRASSWALGYIDEFRDIPLRWGEDDPCYNLVFSSSETEVASAALAEREERWLEAAETALANNENTFAVLRINELLDEQGLLAQLKAKGYSVREP